MYSSSLSESVASSAVFTSVHMFQLCRDIIDYQRLHRCHGHGTPRGSHRRTRACFVIKSPITFVEPVRSGTVSVELRVTVVNDRLYIGLISLMLQGCSSPCHVDLFMLWRVQLSVALTLCRDLCLLFWSNSKLILMPLRLYGLILMAWSRHAFLFWSESHVLTELKCLYSK